MSIRPLEGADTTRMDALSDGLFAIVLTLLVLQFQVPEVSPDRATTELPVALTDQQPLLLSYLLSFLVVGLYWIVHHNLFRHIVRHDRVLLWLNLLFLLVVSFLPFPTELLGVYGTHLTWSLYAINIILVGVLLTLVWWYAWYRDFLDETIDDRMARLITIRGLIAPAVFVLSVGVAAVSLPAAFLTPVLIFPAQTLWVRYVTNTEGDEDEDTDAE